MTNWMLWAGFVCLVILLCFYVWRFAGLPAEEQMEKVREWLLYAVVKAERELGGGTGQVKLRAVYDMFLQRFPDLAMWLTFTSFSGMVDRTLEELGELLENNRSIRELVERGEEHG